MKCINKNIVLVSIFLFLVGCSSGLKETVITVINDGGFSSGDPDEFLTVTKSPLIMPPDYQLRPPKTGAKPISEKETSVVARSYVLKSESTNSDLSIGEQNILRKANTAYANPRIKEELFLEEGVVTRDETLKDYLIRLKRDKAEALNLYTEKERLEKDGLQSIPLKKDIEDNIFKSEVEVVNLNKITLDKLLNKNNISSNVESLKYGMNIEDVLNNKSDISDKIDKSVDGIIEYEDNELPPIDKQPTLIKGLMGGLMGGFGIF